ncbi:MAG: GNAT family N-acetyltransferase [Lentimicrobium sp.]|jgi:ribosomal protein S18 acetylase RimI-like enzyme|nr:GNAT family N-acetyltransferase [Lentimicrobium sp.]
MSEIIIRLYKADDYTLVEAFWERNGLGGAQRGDDALIIAKTLAAGGHLLVVTTLAGVIMGTAWLTNDKRRTYLHHFGIDEAYRRKGYATKLLRVCLDLAVKDGYQIKIEVHRNNSVALHLYRKARFHYLGDYEVHIIRDISGLETDL